MTVVTAASAATPSTVSAAHSARNASIAETAQREWELLVRSAVLGTDRRPLPVATSGWDVWAGDGDPAVDLLGRAAAIVVARRAGACALAPPAQSPVAPVDPRPPCSAAATQALSRLLRGGYDMLLPEWFTLCESSGVHPPWVMLPSLLLRGRRLPAFDAVVRRVAGPRAEWLIDNMPELGIRAFSQTTPAGAEPFAMPPRPVDSGAVVSAIASTFHDGQAHWATAATMRQAIAALDPAWLAPLLNHLQQMRFQAVTERTRVDLIGLAQFRVEMINAFTPATSATMPPVR